MEIPSPIHTSASLAPSRGCFVQVIRDYAPNRTLVLSATSEGSPVFSEVEIAKACGERVPRHPERSNLVVAMAMPSFRDESTRAGCRARICGFVREFHLPAGIAFKF